MIELFNIVAGFFGYIIFGYIVNKLKPMNSNPILNATNKE